MMPFVAFGHQAHMCYVDRVSGLMQACSQWADRPFALRVVRACRAGPVTMLPAALYLLRPVCQSVSQSGWSLTAQAFCTM